MSELWTSPKAGPLPSGHLVIGWITGHQIAIRCGLRRDISDAQIAALSPEPPSTSEGRACETCLRLANRDRPAASIAGNDPEQFEDDEAPEDDGSTWPPEAG